MPSRRAFLKSTLAALGTAGAAAPLSARARVQGANDRIRLAVIGCGNRAGRVFDAFARHTDVEWVAGCDVAPAKLQRFMTPARQTFRLQIVTDYRRLLDRPDIDAVLVATPDVSHAAIAIDAMHASKDVYVETPAANTIPSINAMIDVCRRTRRVVQVGAEQRSREHFTNAKAIVDGGVLGDVRHVAIVQPGSGLVGDLGADHVDVAHWLMNADNKVPQKTAAVGLFLNTQHPDPQQVPDTFSISWEYDDFVMTFANGEIPRPQDDIEGTGTFFVGDNGSLQVNGVGYALRPPAPRRIRKSGPPPPPTAKNVLHGRATPVERSVYVNPRGGVEDDDALDAHVKNFLDCVKSRQKPNADMEIGYHSALPCLLALEAMRQSTVLGWDPAARRSRPL